MLQDIPFKNLSEVAKLIDHTSLKPTDTPEKIIALTEEAKTWGFKAVCVNPSYVNLASQQLKGTDIEVATVVGFPLGATTTQAKVFETKNAIENGATEIDMVIAIGRLISNDYEYVLNDIASVVEAAGDYPVKAIIETCYLTKDQIIKASELAVEAGASFVKTSTGFGTSGATVEDVKLIRKTIGNKAKIKASGGIRTFEKLVQMVNAGANRIGASSGVKIMQEAKEFFEGVEHERNP